MTSVLLELVRHKTWATQQLLAFCEAQADEINATAPGTYGSIRQTLTHLVNSDRSYFRRLHGEQPWERMDENSTELSTLAERFVEIAPEWEAMAQDASLADRDLQYPKGEVVKGSVVFAQSLHHGDVHRAHVLSILGARGFEVPELDLWEYADERKIGTPATQ
jgi:uncharacterized damage-inducible protein DinB